MTPCGIACRNYRVGANGVTLQPGPSSHPSVRLIAMRTTTASISALFALLGAALAGCFGTEVPPHTPEKSPLADAPPAKPTADATKRQDAPGERKGKFDKEQVGRVLMRATRTAGECAKIHTEGPFGELTVKLTLSSTKGKVSDAVLPAPFAGTDIGKCIEKAFESEIIPTWGGDDEHMDAPLVLKKPEAEAPADGKDPKAKGK
jgi:hypothetical protein